MGIGGTLMSLLVKLGVDAADFERGMDAAENRTSGLARTFDGLATVGGGILFGAVGAATAGGLAFGKLGYEAVMAAGRVDQLIGVNRVLADNLDISQELVREQSAALRDQGIEAAIAEVTLAKMMQANLDLAEATDIARIAQNSAVIAGENSSDSMDAIIHGITTLNPLVLRSRGLVIDQAAAYEELAESLGIAVADLSAAEKQQAMLNAVKAAGVKIEGAYDESMKNPIKQLGSMKRLINDVAVAAGGPLLDGFSSIIAAASDLVKWFGAAVEEGGTLRPFLEEMGVWFEGIGAKVAEFVQTAIANIPQFIEGLKSAVNWLKEHKGVVVGVLAAMGVAVVAFGVSVAAAIATAMAPLLPILGVMAAVGAAAYVLYEAWTNNWGGIRDHLTNFWNNTMKPIGEKIKKIFDGIRSAIAKVVEKVTAFINKIKNIKLPSWLTPGSATPFEIGLWGIADAMKAVSRFEFAPVVAPATSSIPRGGGMGDAQTAELLRRIADKGSLDEVRLARLIRDAILQVVG